MFRSLAPDIALVLLDLAMPRMDGEEAFREIRALREDVKVILCSGYTEEEATERFADQGLDGFLQKPFGMGKLEEKIRKIGLT